MQERLMRRSPTMIIALGAFVWAGCGDEGNKPAGAAALGDSSVMIVDGEPIDSSFVDAERPDVERIDDPCHMDGGCPPGTWVNVTPAGANLTDALDCGNYGTETVQVDPLHPEQLYTLFFCQGIWKSNDYGQTWTGPINTGVGGATAGDCAGGITIPTAMVSSPPTMFASCIRGNGQGFNRSTNGGVDWTHVAINVPNANGQFYPPVADPYDATHLLMAGHGVDVVVESLDGGMTWTAIPLAPQMIGGATGSINFIDTGKPQTTRTTWLWIAQPNGGNKGTWRTTTSGAGASWTQVDTNEHNYGVAGIYQPDTTSGVVYMGGLYSAKGWGLMRSEDYGVTWTHLGGSSVERVVFGTPQFVYAMDGNETPLGQTPMGDDPAYETAPQPGLSWAAQSAPAGMAQGPFEAAVTNDGAHNIIVLASWTSGLWRYVEPSK